MQGAISDLCSCVGKNILRDALSSILRMKCLSQNFKKHPHVINGCSDLMVECFYENGVHSRSAVGVYTLPNNIAVEIEGIFKLK